MTDEAPDQTEGSATGDDPSAAGAPQDDASTASVSPDEATSSTRTAGGDDVMREAAQELLRAARSFLDAAERTLSDDETMQRWAERGQDMVRGFLAGFASDPAAPRRPDDDDGIEHIPVE